MQFIENFLEHVTDYVFFLNNTKQGKKQASPFTSPQTLEWGTFLQSILLAFALSLFGWLKQKGLII
jgi:hypothetical protein